MPGSLRFAGSLRAAHLFQGHSGLCSHCVACLTGRLLVHQGLLSVPSPLRPVSVALFWAAGPKSQLPSVCLPPSRPTCASPILGCPLPARCLPASLCL